MAISPWYAGQTLPIWNVNWPTMNLTGASLTVFFAKEGGATTTGGGVFNIVYAFGGQFTYAPVSGDLNTPGIFAVQFQASFTNGTTGSSDPTLVTVITPE